ncbi:MAG: autotransporter outer membrane beta-barrel domain-containing protein, partial [Kiritimatiellaeota bacterium]|nr:autotransporter outer membrane beta-barrel domain-containing protein [Kiritimatiellota bacterium]
TVRGIYREDELQGDEFGGFKVRTRGIQAGVSWPLEGAMDPAKGRLDLGLLVTAIQSETSYKTLVGLDAKAKEFGFFTTLQRGIWHTDLLLNMAYNKYEMTNDSGFRDGSTRVRYKGWTPTLALETGWGIKLGKRMTLEPQAQIVWQHQQLDRARDSYDRIYTFESTDSLIARAGLRWHALFQRKNSALALVPYLGATIGKEFRARHRFTVATTDFENDLGGTETSLECGLTLRLSEKLALYANAAWTDSDPIKTTCTTAGLRMRW